LIQAVLGHDKLDTTARYTRVATGRIAAIASPLDQLGGQEKPSKKKAKPAA
jgi:integrase/recombinase XerD